MSSGFGGLVGQVVEAARTELAEGDGERQGTAGVSSFQPRGERALWPERVSGPGRTFGVGEA